MKRLLCLLLLAALLAFSGCVKQEYLDDSLYCEQDTDCKLQGGGCCGCPQKPVNFYHYEDPCPVMPTERMSCPAVVCMPKSPKCVKNKCEAVPRVNLEPTVPEFEGILRAPCYVDGSAINVCQATPKIEFRNNKNCWMDFYLETPDSKEGWTNPENIRGAFCSFTPWHSEQELVETFVDKEVKITGWMETLEVCTGAKATEAECSKQEILVPNSIELT